MKKLFQKMFAIFGILALSLGWLLVPMQTANSAMNCDANAVIYCGASDIATLNRKIKNGTGKPYQSGSELTSLFAKYGYHPDSDAKYLREGYVTNTNEVYVNGVGRVATNVQSMGRSYMPGSSDVPGISYPLWFRRPEVSFRSSRINAWVYLNYDNSMRYAIIKSCGNIVKGVYRTEPTYKLTVWKYNDLDRDGVKDSNEPTLPNWLFDVTGPNGFRETLTTSPNGGITRTRLKKGTYTITERQKNGWESTTGLSRTVTINDANRAVWFGNATVRPLTYWLEIKKFHDENQDGDRDFGEDYLPGWEFRVEGLDNDTDRTVRTDTFGTARVTGLEAGRYRITEVSQPDWITITHPIQTIEFSGNRTIEFGNYLPELIQLRVVKFHDRDGDTRLDANEEGLAGWRFRVTGPNGFNQIITTDFSGDYTLTDLEPGNYTVTEILEEGWENTTGLTIARELTEDPSTQVFIFGNRRIEDPEEPGGGELPKSGPVQTAAMAFGSMSLSGGALAWLRSKKNLLSAFKK